MARDAQLSNDRVATENFQQHAEHYLRLLAHAQKDQEARREQQEKENRGRNADREKNRVENGSDVTARNASDLEKDSSASLATSEGKGHSEVTQENSQPDKDSSNYDDDRQFKENRRKRNNNIQPDAINIEENKSSEDTSKEAAE